MVDLPRPEPLGLPPATVIAVPADGLTVYRLVRGPSVTRADFVPLSPSRARLRRVPELLRAGLSHYLSVEQAHDAIRRTDSRVAAVALTPDLSARVARTGRAPGHVTVWALGDELANRARVVA